MIQSIEIVAFKKRAFIAIKDCRKDWVSLFLNFYLSLKLNCVIIFLANSIITRRSGVTKKKIEELLIHPTRYPDIFVWYFQKLIAEEENEIPYQNQRGRNQFFESFLILFSALENQPEYRELLKKMYTMLSGKRYALVRKLLQETGIDCKRVITLSL